MALPGKAFLILYDPAKRSTWISHVVVSITVLVREAKEALGPNGNLEKDQLNRVTIVNFIRWFQRREQRRVREEARLRNPPLPWKVRLEAWRKV